MQKLFGHTSFFTCRHVNIINIDVLNHKDHKSKNIYMVFITKIFTKGFHRIFIKSNKERLSYINLLKNKTKQKTEIIVLSLFTPWLPKKWNFVQFFLYLLYISRHNQRFNFSVTLIKVLPKVHAAAYYKNEWITTPNE